MGDNMFDKFNALFGEEGLKGLKEDIESAATKNGDFVEVPHGEYECKVVKLELAESKNHNPMAKVWYEIVAGEFKGQKLFQNQMLTTGFGIYKMNELLTSLESGVPVVFEDFNQYDELLKQIFAEIDNKAEYQVAYTQNNKGFNVFEIVQRFYN